ncbi:signal recognition particle-docking protein FtsY [Fundicoccus ignavus]|uniref:Signal recognition particle receptor FtsY n=1 Tax=Fundicoccus ignavus TaxID=2664442 RepID=A0A6I2GDI8_9LACT|nr:signal recognition particle-docking protein FtsY [Fundicoccus ignavus]MRI81345.1 signal recognition particle-docking protein FtsY [Fundicoccus ignavus]MRI85336.1 signal recognition particle-docking protein FtsY [Fundicoccus ignavus]MRJ48057.1 signal recognition particle-docking protein FtsY [Fundicoccus ignavus]
MGLFDRIKRAFTGEDKVVKEEIEQESSAVVFDSYDKGLEKTRTNFTDLLSNLFTGFREVDEDFYEDLEETLIGADVGFNMTLALTDAIRDEIESQNVHKPEDVKRVMLEKMVQLYEREGGDNLVALKENPDGPTVILFVGVNGVGKTTSVGKIGYQLKAAGHKVLMAAADTFRAGAVEQLNVWGQRLDIPVVTGQDQGDPASVVFDAVKRANEEQFDYLLVDTAGRLQTKINLMDELAKIKRIIERENPNGVQEVLLVLDATTGQNALIQAKQFNEATDISGLVLTKLDGTAKGGVVLSIRYDLDIPVKYIGLGEQATDLQVFDSEQYMYNLVKGAIEKN